MPDIEYRQATEKDAAAITAVGAAVWDELGANSGLPQRPTKDGVASLLSSYGDRGAMFVCDNAGEIWGFAAVSPDPDDAEQAVMGVWLLRAARRKGVGRELALMATDFARAAGYRKLRGTLPEGNEPALSFFSDIGSMAQVVGQGMQYELPL
jgi:ribosomal protein S18 acetylase RimI-like enzyme